MKIWSACKSRAWASCEVELDEPLANHEKINLRLQRILDTHTGPWGVKVVNVEVRQVDMPESMLRAGQAGRSGTRKALQDIHAEGKFLAVQRLMDAAKLLATEPVSIQLRYHQTMTEIGVEKDPTIVFPLPLNILEDLSKVLERATGSIRPKAAASS
jgi:hypothetical protein